MSTPFKFSFPFNPEIRPVEPINTLRRKKGGVYYAQIGPAKRRVSLHTKAERVAEARSEELRKAARILVAQAMLPQAVAVDKATQTPLAEALEQYIRHCKATKAKTTVTSDICYLRQSFGEICESLKRVPRKEKKEPDTPDARRRRKQRREPKTDPEVRYIRVEHVEDITPDKVSDFISKRIQSGGLKPKTANRYRDSILAFTSWAIQFKGVKFPDKENPVAAAKKYKEGDPEVVFLSLDQITEQLNALADKPELQVHVALYIYAGLRRSEALWLTADDVDLKRDVILIRAKTVNGEFWEPKNKKSRIVPINSDLRPYLQRYKRRPSVGNWFFPSPEGLRWDADNFSEHLRDANRAKKLDWSCWEYRHTFGSQLVIRGESIYKVAEVMGNSPDVCRKHYARLTPESLTGVTEFPKLEEADGPGPDTPKDTTIRRGHLRLLDSPAAQGRS
jgi:integrase